MSVASGRIRYISSSAPVSMGDDWYGLAGLNHFWIQRRFEVVRRLADQTIRQATNIAEVGCGHGLLQRQIEDCYGREVTGFDLNELALKQTASRISSVCCYDLFQRNQEFKGFFDLILLFDVLEHLRDEDEFVKAIQFHLAPQGKILINVPASQHLWSRFDEAVGHFRRYNIDALGRVAKRAGMALGEWSYWGAPLTPLLALRKVWLLTRPREKAIATGFDPGNPVMNRLLYGLSRCERIPQHLVGSSLMAVLETQR
jgi:SAM-dependent methyltransferase